MSRRREQLASTIQRLLQQEIARGLHDPRVRGIITITGVEISDDGKHATAGVSVLPEERESLTMHGLRAAAARLRREIMGKLRTREMPRIEFRLDRSIKTQAEVLGLINKANAEAAAHADPGANDAGSTATDPAQHDPE